jgi:capsular exopolysaccharide synthesis family protein
LARSENQQQINRTNAQAAALPVTERQLLGIERKFELNNELYTFLLETRAEQQMQKASNRADSEIIDPADARFSNLVKPIPMRINLLALTAGIGITYLIIFLNFIFNKKLSEEDLRRITNLPVLGNIPHNNEKTTKVVLDHPKLFISEAYRQLRSRMQFFTKEVEKPVILVTSSIPGEGKTFTAINLSSAYSLLGKKTILIGFDLRKPKIAKDFNLMNEKGVSTWLIGQEELENMIQETNYENLHIITSGPIPPNPSELLALDKTQKLINLLKEEYDCIIIDAPPLGIVSDTIRLISMADVCILVVRPGHSLRDMFKKTNDELIASGVKSSSIVINDSKSMKKQYNYGEIYGYIDEKNGMRKHFLKRHTKDETTV